MYTSIFLFAVAGLLPGADLTAPAWQTDYARARQLGASEQKPLAVVLGTGRAGWENVRADETARDLLARHFITVYIDTATPAGKALATAFEMPSGRGVVLSDRRGEHQAFWHEGSLASPDLVRNLQRVALLPSAPATTETNAAVRTSYYPPTGLTAGQFNSFGYLGGFSGGCST